MTEATFGTYIPEFDPGDKDEALIDCCILCGSAGVIHFDERVPPAQVFHRCLRCLAEYTGCNFGDYKLDPHTRLSGLILR